MFGSVVGPSNMNKESDPWTSNSNPELVPKAKVTLDPKAKLGQIVIVSFSLLP